MGKLAIGYLPAVVTALFTIALASAQIVPPSDDDHSRQLGASVIDGDTLEIDGRIIQLYGIDAPELGEICADDGVGMGCGMTAAFELNKRIEVGREPLACSPAKDLEHQDEFVCEIGKVDLAVALLKAGYALAAADAGPGYHEAEETARKARLGVWHSELISPESWQGGEQSSSKFGTQNNTCPIKGIVSSEGQRLYYVPTDRMYQSVSLEASNGDRSFCSDEAAREAGWRREGEIELEALSDQ